jgi:hypothetical protein
LELGPQKRGENIDTRGPTKQEALSSLQALLDRACDILEDQLSPKDMDDVQVYWRLDGLVNEAANIVAGLREYPQEWWKSRAC